MPLLRDKGDAVISCMGIRKKDERLKIPGATLKDDITALTRSGLERETEEQIIH